MGIGTRVQQEANTGVWQDSGGMTGSLGKSHLQVEPEASSPAYWQSLQMDRSCKVNSSWAQVGDSKELFLPTQKVFNRVVVLYLRCHSRGCWSMRTSRDSWEPLFSDIDTVLRTLSNTENNYMDWSGIVTPQNHSSTQEKKTFIHQFYRVWRNHFIILKTFLKRKK